MKFMNYIENFLRCQIFIAIIVLCIYLAYRRKYIEGFLGFSDYAVDFNKKLIDVDEQKKILKTRCESGKYDDKGPGFDCLRVGFYCHKS